jgi:hypothetical protein
VVRPRHHDDRGAWWQEAERLSGAVLPVLVATAGGAVPPGLAPHRLYDVAELVELTRSGGLVPLEQVVARLDIGNVTIEAPVP